MLTDRCADRLTDAQRAPGHWVVVRDIPRDCSAQYAKSEDHGSTDSR